jgi:predicted 3-demethylubiquinone-9 3-methyltransferase (glyoxalase superfamily)
MQQKITPMLWYDDQAEQAAELYVSVFSGRPGAANAAGPSKIVSVSRYGEAGPGTPGSAMTVEFQLEGQTFTGLNAGPQFQFTEAISFVVACEDQAEVDYFWDALTADGGKEDQCGWLKDRFGLSWQIVPNEFNELASDPDPAKSQAVVKAMLGMVKLDVAELRRAYENA